MSQLDVERLSKEKVGLLTVATAIAAVINLADFFFWRHRIPDLIGAFGFALMTYGTFKNAHTKLARDQYVYVTGIVIILVVFVARLYYKR